MLIVMEYGDAQVLQLVFDLEALGRRDVFEIDASENWGNPAHRIDDLLSVLGIQADGPCIDPCKLAKQQRLALHHRDGRMGTDIAQPQHR